MIKWLGPKGPQQPKAKRRQQLRAKKGQGEAKDQNQKTKSRVI